MPSLSQRHTVESSRLESRDDASPQLDSDLRFFLAAGRRDRQVLGQRRRRAAWARRHQRPGHQCRWSVPTEIHHRVSLACHACLIFSSLLLSSLELSDNTTIYEPGIRALLGTASHFCEAVVLKLRAVPPGTVPRVSSLLTLLSACRYGEQPRFGRPGEREDGRSRHRWGVVHVRPAGKAAPEEIGWLRSAECGV